MALWGAKSVVVFMKIDHLLAGHLFRVLNYAKKQEKQKILQYDCDCIIGCDLILSSNMGGANPNNPLLQNQNPYAGASPLSFQANQQWQVPSANPEAISQGAAAGMGAFTNDLNMALLAKYGKGANATPNATQGYDTAAQAAQAAPFAGGFSNVSGVGWVPQATPVSQ